MVNHEKCSGPSKLGLAKTDYLQALSDHQRTANRKFDVLLQ